MQNAVEKYPQLKFHVFDKDGNLRRHMYLFVGDVNVKWMDGNETRVGEKDVVSILAAAVNQILIFWVFTLTIYVRTVKYSSSFQ